MNSIIGLDAQKNISRNYNLLLHQSICKYLPLYQQYCIPNRTLLKEMPATASHIRLQRKEEKLIPASERICEREHHSIFSHFARVQHGGNHNKISECGTEEERLYEELNALQSRQITAPTRATGAEALC